MILTKEEKVNIRFQEFLEKTKLVHKNTYDYSKVIYVRGTDKIEIVCKQHGTFTQTPENHLRGKGCPKCASIKIGKLKGYTTEIFIQKANKVHENKYLYDNVDYSNSLTKIKITCPTHGEFEQLPSAHLTGQGCSKCKLIERTLSIEDFKIKAKEVHGDKYNFDNSRFITGPSRIKVSMQCPEHGEIIIGRETLLKGGNCKFCYGVGFSRTGWANFCKNKGYETATCYIIRLYNEFESFIKIGITTDFQHRVRSFPYKREILYLIKDSPVYIFDKEKELHKKFKEFKYKPNISFCGEQECFNLNIYR